MEKTAELMTPRGAALLALRDEARELVGTIDLIEDWGWVAAREDSERLDECIAGTKTALGNYRRSSPPPAADGQKRPPEDARVSDRTAGPDGADASDIEDMPPREPCAGVDA